MAAEITFRRPGLGDWLSRETEFEWFISRLTDAPAKGLEAWSRTSSGVIALLLFLQFTSGILMAFHYVPTASDAYTTVAYIEQAVRDGAWIRSIHYHSAALLPIVLAFYLFQMLVRGAMASNKTAWIFGVAALVLVLAAGATGYALPWDARALNGVNIAASLTGNMPFMGTAARTWLIGGSSISTITLSRFYALHVWAIPMLILTSVTARLFIFGKKETRDREGMTDWVRSQFTRNAFVAALVFIAIAGFSFIYPAPFGPQAEAAATYLPRPGPQFLWLFEMQKYTDGPAASVLAMGFPGLIISGFLALPLMLRNKLALLRVSIGVLFAFGFGTAGILTAVAIYQDKADSKISAQLAKQEEDEAKFRRSPFEPQFRHASKRTDPETTNADNTILASSQAPVRMAIPSTYAVHCAKCHGASGEGTDKFPELVGLTTREEDQLSPDLILAIIDDPKKVGRSSKMPAYKKKLNDEEKQELVLWIRSLSPEGGIGPVQTARIEQTQN